MSGSGTFSLPRDKEALLRYLNRLDYEHQIRDRRERWERRVASGARDPLTMRIAEKLRKEKESEQQHDNRDRQDR